MMLSMTSKGEGKLGYTTTVKEQVDEIEVRAVVCRIIWSTSRKYSTIKGNSKTS